MGTVTAITTGKHTLAYTELLTPAEVALMFRVDAKTVTRWAKAGRLSSVRTPGGHRRYDAAEVREFLAEWQAKSR